MSDDDVMIDLAVEVRGLANEMVWLEQWAKEAYARKRWVRVGELHTQREEVQQRRSELMRELWSRRGGRRIREALRQAKVQV